MDALMLRSLVSYEPETGVFRWRQDHKNLKWIKAGDEVGKDARKGGYRCTSINKKQYYQHRLVWLYVHGEWPLHQVDHINGDKADNRLCNLRLATKNENAQNIKKLKNNSSGVVGAYRHWSGRWYSSIMVNGKAKYLGSFGSAEEAGKAYSEAKKTFHLFSPDLPTR